MFGASVDHSSPGEGLLMLAAHPLRPDMGSHSHILRPQPIIASRVPLLGNVSSQGSQGATRARALASTHRAACVSVDPVINSCLPLVSMTAGAHGALPPDCLI